MDARPPNHDPPTRTLHERLDSWKAIAAYVKRDVTTVQRWERREGMPVHRHLHDKQGSVYAFCSELDAWSAGRRVVTAQNGEESPRTSEPAARVSIAPEPAVSEGLAGTGRNLGTPEGLATTGRNLGTAPGPGLRSERLSRAGIFARLSGSPARSGIFASLRGSPLGTRISVGLRDALPRFGAGGGPTHLARPCLPSPS